MTTSLQLGNLNESPIFVSHDISGFETTPKSNPSLRVPEHRWYICHMWAPEDFAQSQGFTDACHQLNAGTNQDQSDKKQECTSKRQVSGLKTTLLVCNSNDVTILCIIFMFIYIFLSFFHSLTMEPHLNLFKTARISTQSKSPPVS